MYLESTAETALQALKSSKRFFNAAMQNLFTSSIDAFLHFMKN